MQDFYLKNYTMNITHENELYRTNHEVIIELHEKLHWTISKYESDIYKAICQDPNLAKEVIIKLKNKREKRFDSHFIL